MELIPNGPKDICKISYNCFDKTANLNFSKLQSGFRKGYSAQHCLLAMIEKWKKKKKIRQGDVFGALLTDLSKAFDCIPHDFIIAKLEAHGLEIGALRLIHAYLINRKQRIKVNETYSSWKDIIFVVPEGSILGSLLFNIHLCD